LIIIFTPDQDADILTPSCSDVMFDGLPDFSIYPCVIENNAITSKRYTNTSSRTVVASPYEISYKQSCATICTSIDAGGDCVGTDTQIDNYEYCVTTLKPDNNCSSLANPIGKVGSTVYYMDTYYPPGAEGPRTVRCVF
jgi:hypothetical protein